ncbi:MAG: TolB family protein [Mycobacteriales bacterium]
MTPLDLHQVVPDPPDELLDWPALNTRIRRRRVARQVTAVVGVMAVVAGAITLGVTVSHKSTPPSTISPTRHADGRILFTQVKPGSPNYLPLTSLYSVDPSGRGAPTRVTRQPGGVDQATASPDGSRVAYTEETYGRTPRERYVNGEYVHVVNADGTDDQTVYRCASSSCGELSWSPDGNRLLFTDNRAHILEPDGHVATICAGGCPGPSPTQASWAPDSRQLAFQYWVDVPLHNGQSGPGGHATVNAIGLMNADGSHPRLLTDENCTASRLGACTQDTGPIWSPDGSMIAFVRTTVTYLRPDNSRGGPLVLGLPEQLVTIELDGATQTVWQCTTCGLVNAAWSPSGRWLAFVSDDYTGGGRSELVHLRLLDLADGYGYGIPLSHLPHTVGDIAPSIVWSPSGTRLLLGGGGNSLRRGVSVVAVSGREISQPRQLSSTGFAPIAWLPQE